MTLLSQATDISGAYFCISVFKMDSGPEFVIYTSNKFKKKKKEKVPVILSSVQKI